jgi:universal stress protein E
MARFKPRTIMAALAEPERRVQPVLDRAAQIARAFASDIVLFHAAYDSALSGGAFARGNQLARARGAHVAEGARALERRADRLRAQGLTVRTLCVWEEPAHESIIRAAIRDGADLVVAGPHEPRAARGAFSLRQTDWQLLRLCPRPLLLVRPGAPSSGPVLAALDPMHQNDKPAALDRALAEAAGALANALRTPLYAAHSISPAIYTLDATEAEKSELRAQASSALRRTLERAKVSAARTYVVDGRPEKTLPALARELAAQVIVMGAISRRGLKRLALGDTAERIIHSSPCDLLILKPKEFDFRPGKTRQEAVVLPP